ncbi:YjeF family domain-containing protein [Polytolypa hystricis UAMH7299]|uniref:Enhancer of mRNA-decapping protein 3 n=1 Tax=Polytolypa hystricis (strain UAMH7299) TaxID=1447883 RepID=A0A2B7Z2S4_POLH7|nr:YjeF family domain-containing protein [Polytolypa hystricis UAMH7299]
MAAEFVGYTVLVTLKSPPNYQLQGVVAGVVGQRLSIRDATLLWSGQRLPLYHIDASGIADLELSSQEAPSHPPSATVATLQPGRQISDTLSTTQPPSLQTATNLPQVAPQPEPPFVDPAILSYKKPAKGPLDATPLPESVINRDATASSPVMIADSAVAASSRATQTFPTAVPLSHPTGIPGVGPSATAATLIEPFSNLNSGDGFVGNEYSIPENNQQDLVPEGRKGAAPLTAPLKYTGKRSRRGGRGKLQKEANQQTSDAPQTNEGNFPPTPQKGTDFGAKGWRQTAFVEPASPAKNGRARRSRARNGRYAEDVNGWATEDATDIQEMGDFDFQSNLSKFDKRRVFEEIRNDDTTAGEERLVSFNRRPKPGTNGGKNLHYTENVLDSSPKVDDKWNSEAGETDEDDEVSEERFSSGRNSGRARSRTSSKVQTRKGSTIPNPSFALSQISSLNRGHLTSSRTASPQSRKQAALPSSPVPGSAPPPSGSLRLVTTNRHCPCVAPLQMLEIEQIAIGELGMTEEMVTENAGRGIAEAAVSQASDLAASSTILIFTGNHRTGTRAVSAARHFRNRGYRVTLCILGMDREDEFIDGFRKQVEIFKNINGRVMRWQDLSTALSASDLVPDLVVDGLFGMHIAFEDLRIDDQAVAFEIVSWINRSNIETMSVDIPSGLSASSGEATLAQGARLAVNAKFIVCLGAPKTGLLNALNVGEGLSWQMSVADIGINQTAWRKYGTRRRHGVDFGNQWLVSLRYQPATP